jgi:hypothetical protein
MTPIYPDYCIGEPMRLTLDCGYVIDTCCMLSAKWLANTLFCPGCAVSPQNRPGVLELIQRCSHTPSYTLPPGEPNHKYDACLTGFYNGTPLPPNFFHAESETWIGTVRPRKLNT